MSDLIVIFPSYSHVDLISSHMNGRRYTVPFEFEPTFVDTNKYDAILASPIKTVAPGPNI